MTKVVTYRVLLREGEDDTDSSLERTYRSLVPPRREGGPYLSQEGETFFIDELPSSPDEPIRGWCSRRLIDRG
jgi:hypothetical protein